MGLIVLPVVGNAVEHISAVTVAMKNKVDLALGGEFSVLRDVLLVSHTILTLSFMMVLHQCCFAPLNVQLHLAQQYKLVS